MWDQYFSYYFAAKQTVYTCTLLLFINHICEIKQQSPPPKLKTSKGEIPSPLETASERGKKHGDKEKP
jgi:hypothetical protein